MEVTFGLLSKKDFQCWDRSCDLRHHSPAWSLGAMEAQGCSSTFGDLVFISLEALRAFSRNVVYEALQEHLVIMGAWRPLKE